MRSKSLCVGGRVTVKRGTKLWERFEVHYTPKHASWLNQAETQISMFSQECLGRDRIASIVTLKKRSSAWARRATNERRTINWKFTRAKARKTFYYDMDSIRLSQGTRRLVLATLLCSECLPVIMRTFESNSA